ncbi:group IIC secretory phospholipase A2 [Marmota flaviventris]|uniref:group IIC secretory phospholipase A2 n=1 Tax=Marmota flaviventris TaxID=93162 RepID=UPI003A8527AC
MTSGFADLALLNKSNSVVHVGHIACASKRLNCSKRDAFVLWKARCCVTHDCCYERLKESGCQPVLNSYQSHIINKTVVCGCSLGPGDSCLCGLKA